MLQLEELRVRHKSNDKLVLDGMNLSRTREKTAIVGPDGSGRSTLFKEVLGLAPVSGGTVRVEADAVLFTREFNLLQRLGGWSPYFMLDGRRWGKFAAQQR